MEPTHNACLASGSYPSDKTYPDSDLAIFQSKGNVEVRIEVKIDPISPGTPHI